MSLQYVDNGRNKSCAGNTTALTRLAALRVTVEPAFVEPELAVRLEFDDIHRGTLP